MSIPYAFQASDSGCGLKALRKVKRGRKPKLTFVAEALDASGRKVLGSKRVTATLK